MPLYLVRHGEAYSETVDPDRSLTERGKAIVADMAQMAASLNVPVSQVLHSTRTRARETAHIFSNYLKPTGGAKEIKGLLPYDDITKIMPELDPSLNLMMVGHLPFLERLASCLVAGSPDTHLVKFQTGGIVCLDRMEKNGPWHIQWALMPEMV